MEPVAAGHARVLWPGVFPRAALLNTGGAVAWGDILFFLHADSMPPANAVALIERAPSNPRVRPSRWGPSVEQRAPGGHQERDRVGRGNSRRRPAKPVDPQPSLAASTRRPASWGSRGVE